MSYSTVHLLVTRNTHYGSLASPRCVCSCCETDLRSRLCMPTLGRRCPLHTLSRSRSRPTRMLTTEPRAHVAHDNRRPDDMSHVSTHVYHSTVLVPAQRNTHTANANDNMHRAMPAHATSTPHTRGAQRHRAATMCGPLCLSLSLTQLSHMALSPSSHFAAALHWSWSCC